MEQNEATEEPCWYLIYEMEGSEYAAWTIRYGSGYDIVAYEVTEKINPDSWDEAKKGATQVLRDAHGMTVVEWKAHRPASDTSPAYWIASIES